MSAARWLQRGTTGFDVGRLAAAYLALGLLKRVVPLRVLVKWSWREPHRRRDPHAERRLVARVIRARRLCRQIDGDCLQRSLVLYRELSRAGADPVLVAGFRQTEGRLRGHAWIVVDGAAVAECEPDTAQFVPAFSFGRRGALEAQPIQRPGT